jgi:hypothetical protein
MAARWAVLPLLLVACGAAHGAAAALPYSGTRTAACLRGAGAWIDSSSKAPATYSFPEIRQQFFWHASSSRTDYAHWNDGANVLFTRTAAGASHLRARLLRVAYSEGATRAEARRAVGIRANAVWLWDLSAKRTALLKSCLR